MAAVAFSTFLGLLELSPFPFSRPTTALDPWLTKI